MIMIKNKTKIKNMIKNSSKRKKIRYNFYQLLMDSNHLNTEIVRYSNGQKKSEVDK